MPPGITWQRPSQFAAEYNKSPLTVRRWCRSGFILTLGYLVVIDPKGRWMIGVKSAS